MITESTVQEALRVIVDNRKDKTPGWAAVSYARIGICLTGGELKVQCLHVLGSIEEWRGRDAVAVRQTLKAFTGRV